MGTALLLGFSAAALRLQTAQFRRGDVSHPIHDAAFLSAPLNADAFHAALDWIRANTAPDSTLSVLPKGAVLNVLSGRRAPNPYFMQEPGTYLRGTPSEILAAYSNSPLTPSSSSKPRHRVSASTTPKTS